MSFDGRFRFSIRFAANFGAKVIVMLMLRFWFRPSLALVLG